MRFVQEPFAQCLNNYTAQDIFGIYVHVPFCVKRCPYCAFASSVIHPVPVKAFVEAVLKEFNDKVSGFAQRRLHTIYFGGGTPSLLEAGAIKTLVEAFCASLNQADEITLEINPEHVTLESALAWKDAGINRVSLGVQSFSAPTLLALGRRHSPEAASASIETLSGCGFEDISIDLIYGAAGSTPSSFAHDLRCAHASAATHLSIYELTLEPYTAMSTRAKRGETVKLNEDQICAQLESIEESALDFERYEISNYSRRQYYSAHNLSCWAGIPYLGLGPGAHAFNRTKDKKVLRWANKMHVAHYLQNPTQCLDFSETLTAQTHLVERLMLGLRTRYPLDLRALIEDTDEPHATLLDALEQCQRRGWLQRNGDLLRSTTLGLRFHDAMSLALMP